jgi:hypothetical protein
MRRHAEFLAQRTGQQADLPLEVLLRRADVHIGSPDDVIASLRADALLPRVTDLILQVHAVDPPHDKTLRSLELIATEVAQPWAGGPRRRPDMPPIGSDPAGVSPDRGRHRGLTVEPRRDDWSFPHRPR